jgi:hypothetical protein
LKSFLLNNPKALNQNPIIKMSAEKYSLCEMEEIEARYEARNNPVEMFHCDGCGCDVSEEVFKECESNRNGENHICPDCYDGEYDEECINCDCLCSSEYRGYIDEEEGFVCDECVDNLDVCEQCGYSTDAEQKENSIFRCSSCNNKHQECIAKYQAIVKSSSSPEEALAKWKDILNSKQLKAEVEEEKVVIQPNVVLMGGKSEVVEGLTEADRRVLVLPKCEQCDSVSNLAEYWWIEDKKEKWTLCEECGIAEEQDKVGDKDGVEPDEEFEAEVSNSHLLEVFGGEVVYNKVKELLKYPDLSSTLRVVWKFGKEHLSLYVYIEGEPFFDAVYPRNHSCDMFYMLEELKKEQDGAKCEECGISTAGRKIRSLWNNALCEECGADSDGEECEDNE